MGTFTQRPNRRSVKEEFDPWNDRKAVERRRLQRAVVGFEEPNEESSPFIAATTVAPPTLAVADPGASSSDLAPTEKRIDPVPDPVLTMPAA
jgi:hypothetical protein